MRISNRLIESVVRRTLRQVIKESEASFDDDLFVNPDWEDKANSYKIALWSGKGYSMGEFLVYGYDEQEALEQLYYYLDGKGLSKYYYPEEELRVLYNEDLEDGKIDEDTDFYDFVDIFESGIGGLALHTDSEVIVFKDVPKMEKL